MNPTLEGRTRILSALVEMCGLDPAQMEAEIGKRARLWESDQVSDFDWLVQVLPHLDLQVDRLEAELARVGDLGSMGGVVIASSEAFGLLALEATSATEMRVRALDDPRAPHTLDLDGLAAALGHPAHEPVDVLVVDIDPSCAARSDLPKDLPQTPMRRLWRFMNPDRGDLFIILGFSVAAGVLTLATPVAVQALVNTVAFGGLVQPLVILGILLLAFLTFAGAIRAFKTYVVEILQRRVFVRVVSDLSVRLPRVPLVEREKRYGPELVNRFFDVLTVQKTGALLILNGIEVILQAAIGLLVLAFYHPFLLFFDLLLLAAIAFVLFGLGRGAIRSAVGESSSKYAVAASLQEIARLPFTFKLSGSARLAQRRLDVQARDYVEARRRHFKVVFRQVIGALVLHALAGTALLTLGGWLVMQGQLTLGQLVAAELIVSLVLASFAKFGKEIEMYYDLAAGVEKLGTLYDLPQDPIGSDWLPDTPTPARVQLRGVSVDEGPETGRLAPLSLTLRPGERLAILGGAGSGKSTLAEVLCGLRAPEHGSIFFDEFDLRSVVPESLREHVALISEVELADSSIEDNVILGRNWIPSSRVREVLSDLGLLEVARGLPDGLDTRLRPFGAPLSKVQCRLLMFARALAGNPRLIVVDGLLDELEPDLQKQVLDLLVSEGEKRSVVVLTSRREVAARLERVVPLATPAQRGGRSDLRRAG